MLLKVIYKKENPMYLFFSSFFVVFVLLLFSPDIFISKV